MNRNQQLDFYMNLSMDKWPRSLYLTAYNLSQRYGFCGEILVSAIEAWLTTRREMSADESDRALDPNP